MDDRNKKVPARWCTLMFRLEKSLPASFFSFIAAFILYSVFATNNYNKVVCPVRELAWKSYRSWIKRGTRIANRGYLLRSLVARENLHLDCFVMVAMIRGLISTRLSLFYLIHCHDFWRDGSKKIQISFSKIYRSRIWPLLNYRCIPKNLCLKISKIVSFQTNPFYISIIKETRIG